MKGHPTAPGSCVHSQSVAGEMIEEKEGGGERRGGRGCKEEEGRKRRGGRGCKEEEGRKRRGGRGGEEEEGRKKREGEGRKKRGDIKGRRGERLLITSHSGSFSSCLGIYHPTAISFPSSDSQMYTHSTCAPIAT